MEVVHAPVAVQATLPASEQLQAALVTANPPLAAVEKQEAGCIEPTAKAKSTFTENSGATQSSNALPATNMPVSDTKTLGAPHENSSLQCPAAISETQLKKAAPQRISLKDYRSRKVSETVVITPLANHLIHFTATRPTPATITEEHQMKHAPPPIIPVLPPLLPPTSQSQPLLPLSPCKLESMAFVLKKEEKDHARSSQEGATDHKKPAHESQIPNTPLPGASSLPSDAIPNQVPQDRDAQTGEVDLKKSITQQDFSADSPVQTQLNTTWNNSNRQKLSPQTFDDSAAGAYAIESMSNPSEGEPNDKERPQEFIDNAPQQPHPEMVDDEEKEEARTPKQLQSTRKSNELPVQLPVSKPEGAESSTKTMRRKTCACCQVLCNRIFRLLNLAFHSLIIVGAM
ncbi:hypothetical protein PCANC_01052 [Puccinia coronata f. sp. avenae]|uniref:Uncharacterized protein n=1 Tax=Puccinia coronata f. sp. avenae TaxID=200324 RepID=A0A2N5W6L7_9BASI|nr:hypothetical protein PCANC_01052 [Puccinia coronata f. sp. avenae]